MVRQQRSQRVVPDRRPKFVPLNNGLLLFSLLFLTSPPISRAQWELQKSSTEASLRGVSAVNERIAWASGSSATILRTTDGGATWQKRVAHGATNRDFRDVHAVNDRTAFILSVGPGL